MFELSRRLTRATRAVFALPGEVARLRRKLALSDARLSRWKARYDALANRLATVRTDARRHLRAATRRGERLRRHVLEPEVLAGQLSMRASLLWHRSSAPEAAERERRFRAASPAYAAAEQGEAALAGQIMPMQLMGLRWSVPLTRPGDAAYADQYRRKQKFPFRAITQTREVALGGAMIDLGANVGRMSIPRVILGDVDVAYCAEPEPLNYACLIRNVRENHLAGLVLPDRVAIGAEDGVAYMQRVASAGGHRVVDGRSPEDVFEVPCLTLDTWVERLGIDLVRLAFVKVDTQGSELHVLHGASRVLACRHVAWQIEVDPLLLSRRGVETKDLYAALRRHFTHFIDLNRHAAGRRVRRVTALAETTRYLADRRDARTDLLLFNDVLPPEAAAGGN